MRTTAAAFALALSILYTRDTAATPLPFRLNDAFRQHTHSAPLPVIARVSGTVEDKSDAEVENPAQKSKQSQAEDGKNDNDGKRKNDLKDRLDTAKTRDGEGSREKSSATTIPHAKGANKEKDPLGKTDATVSDGGGNNSTSTDTDTQLDDEEDEELRIGGMTTSEMIAEARAHSKRLMKGGFIQFFEWLFVLILVAPGTFPFMGCVLLSCASFWRRRFGGANASAPTSIPETAPRAISANSQSAYQRVPHGDHGALVARARTKIPSDDRESEVS